MGISFVLHGSFLWMFAHIMFVSCGLTGVRRQHIRALTAHFVYSLLLYILTLVGALFYFLSEDFTISGYALLMVLALCQAIGLRHSRLLILYLKKQSTPTKAVQTTTTETPKPVAATAPAPVQPSPQYIPMQTLRYPAMPVPMVPMPMMQMPQDNQLNAPQFYPMLQPQFYPYPMPVAPPAPQQQPQQQQ
jgi:hypothetical protein